MSDIKQIGDVTNVGSLDSIDRKKLDPRVKLELLAQEAKITHGRDPRGDNAQMCIVARPRVILQLLIDMGVTKFGTEIELHKPIVIGQEDADLVGVWKGCPIIIRCNVSDDRMWCMPRDMVPPSSQIDRKQAGQLRVHAHAGKLEALREIEN